MPQSFLHSAVPLLFRLTHFVEQARHPLFGVFLVDHSTCDE